jgi:hypothetical protein
MSGESIWGETTLSRAPSGLSFSISQEMLDIRFAEFLAKIPEEEFQEWMLEMIDMPLRGQKEKFKRGVLAFALQMTILIRHGFIRTPEFFEVGSGDQREPQTAGLSLAQFGAKFLEGTRLKANPLFAQIEQFIDGQKRPDWDKVYSHFSKIASEDIRKYKDVDSLRTSFHAWNKRRKRTKTP